MGAYVIGLEGVSCSGKTSLINRHNSKFDYLGELRTVPKGTIDANRWFLQASLERAGIARELSKKTHRNVLLDRTHVSALAYSLSLDATNHTNNTKNLICEFSEKLAKIETYPDFYVYFEADRRIIKNRMKARYIAPHPDWCNEKFTEAFDYFSRKILTEAVRDISYFLIRGDANEDSVDVQFADIFNKFKPRHVDNPCNLEKLIALSEVSK